MRGIKQLTERFRVARIVLLLIVAMLGGFSSAQSLNPIPWPTPAAIPAPTPIIPARQGEPAGFTMIGVIQYASLDQTPGLCNKDDNPSPTPANPPLPAQCKITGGWIEVNNTVIRVPQSTVVYFPNTLITWEEVFEQNPNTHQTDVPFQSGLALADTTRFPGAYETSVQGNIVNGQYQAGIIFIAQSLAAGDGSIQGFIEKFDYAHGIMYVNGNRIQLNDPQLTFTVPNPDGTPATDGGGNPIVLTKGRHSAGQSPDPRFAIDQNNPSVTAESGYPMCIPQTSPYIDGSDGSEGPALSLLLPDAQQDQQCPEKNRPRDTIAGTTLVNIFTMNAPDAVPSPILQDPYLEAPFEVGDFISVVGSIEVDANGPYISATTVMDTSLGVYTWPATDPAYVRIDVTIQGTGGVPSPLFPQEAGVRTRVEGFSTDAFRTVDVSAVDQDCNGNLTFREPAWAANFPVEPGVPGIGIKGRWRARFPQGGDFLPATMNIGARVSGSLPGKTKNGITYSEYQLPGQVFIFPENLGPGNAPPRANIGDITYLVNGMGQLPMVSDVFDSTQIQLGQQPFPFFPNQTMGQLNPFPDSILPAMTCIPGTFASLAVPTFKSTPNPPFAGVTVTLDGTASTPATGPFAWTQVPNPGDPLVAINNPNSAQATFIAPVVSGPQNLTFQLVVGGQGTAVPPSAPATVIVPIIVPPAGTPPVVSATASFTPPPPALPLSGISITVPSAASPVTLTATGVDPSGGLLTFNWVAPAGIVLASGATDGSVQTFTAPTVPELTPSQSFTFTVTACSGNFVNGACTVAGANTSGLASTPVTVTVVVQPVADSIIVNNIVYRRTKGRLVVNVSDFTPNVTLTCTLDIIDPGTGLPYTGVMGPIIPFAQGSFSITFSNIPPPNIVTITSDAGGFAQSGITFLR